MSEMIPIRLFFEKRDRTIYTSHLDLMRAMTRALVRSGLPIWYTQGFHPHLYLTFALPLSLGITGLSESLDFRLTEPVEFPAIEAALSAAMPSGLRVVRVAAPVMEPKTIEWADYRLDLRCDVAEGKAAWETLLALPEILMEKRSKKGMKTVDIKPLLQLLTLEETAEGLAVTLRCRAGVEVNLNPSLALEALHQQTGFSPVQTRTTRFAVWNEDGKPFA